MFLLRENRTTTVLIRKISKTKIGQLRYIYCNLLTHELRVCLSKLRRPQTIFVAIFEFLGAENPHKQQILAEFRKFKILKKYYTCVLIFGQIWFS